MSKDNKLLRSINTLGVFATSNIATFLCWYFLLPDHKIKFCFSFYCGLVGSLYLWIILISLIMKKINLPVDLFDKDQ